MITEWDALIKEIYEARHKLIYTPTQENLDDCIYKTGVLLNMMEELLSKFVDEKYELKKEENQLSHDIDAMIGQGVFEGESKAGSESKAKLHFGDVSLRIKNALVDIKKKEQQVSRITSRHKAFMEDYRHARDKFDKDFDHHRAVGKHENMSDQPF